MIEYSSLTCSHCRKFHAEILPKIKKNYIDTGKVKLIYRDFPFDQLGLLATVMTRCAPPKRYFGFIDVLFQKQADWSRSQDPFGELSRIGKLGGVNPSDFDACLKNQELIDGLVEKRLEGQKKFDVNATPTFIIDETIRSSARSLMKNSKRYSPKRQSEAGLVETSSKRSSRPKCIFRSYVSAVLNPSSIRSKSRSKTVFRALSGQTVAASPMSSKR